MKVAIVFEDIEDGVRFNLDFSPAMESIPNTGNIPGSVQLASYWFYQILEAYNKNEKPSIH